VCNGTACLTAGTQSSLKDKILSLLPAEKVGEMCCLGRCHENSAFHYQGRNYSGDAINQLKDILDNKAAVKDSYLTGHIGTPVLTAPYSEVASYYQILKTCFSRSPEELLDELKKSGLRGRGGAGFPIAFKLASCKEVPSDIRFIICNADEGDPGAYSDRYIMEERPHALLMGMMIAGYITGSAWGVLYIRAEYPESIRIMEEAIHHLIDTGLLGQNILGSGFSFRFKIIKAQGAYICGEETALLSSIEGQRPEVRVRPPYPTQQGLFNKPTVVNNVETLACIPYIMQYGGDNYANIGTEKSKGTKLISLDGHFRKPGIYEADMGTPLSEVIYGLGGGFKSNIKAMHIGGPLGGLVPVHKIKDLTVDFESFAQNGFLLGHASVVCIPEEFPMMEYIRHLFQFTAHESCGKCFPCRLGSTRGFEMFDKALNDTYRIDKNLLMDLLETMEIGSLCALGGGLPLPIKNALTYFEDEIKAYFQ
jgi:NADH-quinone oxidoreductase subunit F